jgi:hypothetical protein
VQLPPGNWFAPPGSNRNGGRGNEAVGAFESATRCAMSLKGWKKVNTWRIKEPLLTVAFLVGLFDHALHRGGASVAAGMAMVLPIIGFRDFWNRWKFWTTVVVFAVLQVPMVLLMRPLVGKSGFPLSYAFGILDCALVIAGIY